ncbi:MAG: carbohydrate ABC transporter permease [Fibrobacterota bacterium]
MKVMNSRAEQRKEIRLAPGFLMALPAVSGLLLFVALPFFMAVALSFSNLKLGSPIPLKFKGFDQYIKILSDPVFLRALYNNGVFALTVVPLQTFLALMLALLINRKMKGVTIFRTVFFMPVVFPMALVAVMWQLLYAPGSNGFINSVMEFISLGGWEPVDFLRNEHYALPALIVLSIWQGVGFQMVILLAGLQDIPGRLYEAAAIDGAGKLQQFLHITLPQLRNSLISVIIITSILSFRLFDQVDILTSGGPKNATVTVMYKAVRTAFEKQQIASASAMTVVFFLILLLITALQRKMMRQEGKVAGI